VGVALHGAGVGRRLLIWFALTSWSPIVWVTDGVDPGNWDAYGYPRWIGSTGDFWVPYEGHRGPTVLYKRVK